MAKYKTIGAILSGIAIGAVGVLGLEALLKEPEHSEKYAQTIPEQSLQVAKPEISNNQGTIQVINEGIYHGESYQGKVTISTEGLIVPPNYKPTLNFFDTATNQTHYIPFDNVKSWQYLYSEYNLRYGRLELRDGKPLTGTIGNNFSVETSIGRVIIDYHSIQSIVMD